MAVSWRIFVFLTAVLVGGFFYSILSDATALLEPMVSIESDSGAEGFQRIRQIWGVFPVVLLIGAGVYLLKQGVIVGR